MRKIHKSLHKLCGIFCDHYGKGIYTEYLLINEGVVCIECVAYRPYTRFNSRDNWKGTEKKGIINWKKPYCVHCFNVPLPKNY